MYAKLEGRFKEHLPKQLSDKYIQSLQNINQQLNKKI